MSSQGQFGGGGPRPDPTTSTPQPETHVTDPAGNPSATSGQLQTHFPSVDETISRSTGNINTGTPHETGLNLAVPSIQPSSSSISSKSSDQGGSNLSNGAVAGIAIAALLVGVIVALIAAFIFFKRRNSKVRNGTVGYNNYTDSTPELVMMQKSAGRNSPYVQVSQTPLHAPVPAPAPAPAPAPNPAPVAQHNPTDAGAAFLPATAHETEVQSRVAALFSQIHRHIDLYYRDVIASITPSMEPELARFGAKHVDMVELLQDCSNSTTALKHALVAYILSTTSPKKESDVVTLFPEELEKARLQTEDATDPNVSTAQALHRRLSVYLYHSANVHSASRRSWSFQSKVREAAEHFSLTYFPWANPITDDQEKEDDLTQIISEALETSIWLFGQPSEYEYRWDSVGTRGVVVSPALVRRDAGDRDPRGRAVIEVGVIGL